jgi:hypothetical protein
MTLLPHPLFFAYWDGAKAYDPTTARSYEGNFINTQLAPIGTDPTELVNIWKRLAKRWRLCYQSVTVIQDGPDLANQGTIAVCQSTFEPRKTYFGFTYPANVPDGTLCHFYPIVFYDRDTEGPSFERAQAMPNAMIGRSRDGAYVPLKLTDTVQQWYSEKDFCMPTNKGVEHTHPAEGWTTAQSTLTPTYPFCQITPFYGDASRIYGDYTPSLMNGSVAHICARNLSDQTSFTFQFRMGIEIQLDPSSTLTPQLKLSPPYDPVALDMYFRIARELKDGYPADFNVTGKLWTVLSSAVRAIAPPLLTAMGRPGLIPVAMGVVDAADSTQALIRERRKKKKAAKRASRGVIVAPPVIATAPAAPLSSRFAAMNASQGMEPSQSKIEEVQTARRFENMVATQQQQYPRRVRVNRLNRRLVLDPNSPAYGKTVFTGV